MARRLGVSDRLLFKSSGYLDGPITDERLNLLHNACDVGLNTCMGEGWGLVSFEHAAAGGAQVLPNHTSLTELWEGSAEMLQPERSYIPRYSLLQMHEVAPAQVAAALQRLYEDHSSLAHRSHQAYERVLRPEYDWAATGAKWRSLFRDSA